ncbi:PREDICTED: DOMON domain-containing protein FRRS1L-like [Priapulus caudatus]|uniref:DOMON domain-containing protein FRRS1L-like n=1 Tax=Priapulus caudatus TaxID=37621 RepID=A0ABM1EKC2_PRICU|nr:PREDICTED: DOMON domain-containing protein FRRS1L-like [Priapulus caudatus]
MVQFVGEVIALALFATAVCGLDFGGCGKTKGCFRYGGNGCTPSTCDYAATWVVDATENTVEVDMTAALTADNGYVAFGFSVDGLMPSADVYAATNYQNNVELKHYSNPAATANSNHPASVLVSTTPTSVTSKSYSDGRISCRFTRPLNGAGVVNGNTYDLTESWYFLYAYGPLSGDGNLAKHYIDHTPTSGKKQRLIEYDDQLLYSTAHHTSATVTSIAGLVVFARLLN